MNFSIDSLSFPLSYPDDTKTGVMHHCHGLAENEEKRSASLKTDFIGMVFNLQEDLHYKIGNTLTGILPKRQYCLAYITSETIEFTVEKGKYSAFCIEFTPYYLARIRDHFPLLTEFLKKAEAQSLPLFSDPRPITPEVLHEIHMILMDKGDEYNNKLFLGPKYVTISMDCLRHLGTIGGLDAIEIDQIRKAHDYIQKNFRFPCRVSQIADDVKMNARHLEHGFKLVYGKTVYKFLTDERMNRATALLRDTNMTLKEVAVAVGYKSAKTFYNIFRRHFGYPPGRLQKKTGE